MANRSLGMKHRCEMRPSHAKAKPGTRSGRSWRNADEKVDRIGNESMSSSGDLVVRSLSRFVRSRKYGFWLNAIGCRS